MSGAPSIAVVVAAARGPAELRRCLASLAPQVEARHGQLVVSSSYPVPADLRALAPAMWLEHPAGTPVPLLRSNGILKTDAELVALIEDDAEAQDGWLDAFAAAGDAGHRVAGGPISLARGAGPAACAAHLLDYGRQAPPMDEGAVRALSGANVAYDRKLLDEVPAAWREAGLNETALHAAFPPHVALRAAPRAGIARRDTRGSGSFAARFFHHGRFFAGRRFPSAPARRFAYAVGCIALPAVLFLRAARTALSKRAVPLPFVLVAPAALILSICWSAGEFVGYACGPGRSGERWA